MKNAITGFAGALISTLAVVMIVIFINVCVDLIDNFNDKDKPVQLNNSIVQQCKHPKDYAEYAYCVAAYENTETVRTLVDIQTEMSEYAAEHPEEVEAYNRKHF